MGKDDHGQGIEVEFQVAAQSSTIACSETRKTALHLCIPQLSHPQNGDNSTKLHFIKHSD